SSYSCLFLVVLTRPSRSLHVPYSTLFRSQTLDEKVFLKQLALKPGESKTLQVHVANTDRTLGTILGSEITKKFKDTLAPDTYVIDRKSTRLNSSHVSISYAVFCLK